MLVKWIHDDFESRGWPWRRKKNAYYQVSASCLKRRGCCYPDLFLSLQIQISPLNVPSRPLRRQTTSQGTKDGRRRVCADGTRRLDPRKQSDSEKLHNICTQKILACVGKYNKKDKKVTQLTCEQLVQAWLLLIMNWGLQLDLLLLKYYYCCWRLRIKIQNLK